MRHQPVLGLTIIALAACSGGGNPPPTNDPGTTAIYEIQGSAAASPLEGQAVTVQGVVTGDFQNNDADDARDLGGFFIQSLPDGDFATSDGIFIFDGNDPTTGVAVGDSVRVEGMVNEFFGETQITASRVTVIGVGDIQPIPVNLPSAATITNSDGELIADLERYEGMLIRLPQTLTVSALFGLERYGEVRLAQGGRPYQFTNQNTPNVAGYRAHREAVAARTVVLDDGRREANTTPIQHLTAGASAGYSIRTGDEITDLTGTLRYSRGSGSSGTETYRLMPTEDPRFVSSNPRPTAPKLSGALRVASYNTLNFFSSIDAGQSNCGPAGNSGCRGADSSSELERQLTKLVTAIDLMDADIVGLIEIENNGGAALQVIVDRLNSVSSSTYAYVDTGAIGDDAISTGFLYKSNAVSPAGVPVILDSGVDPRFNDARNRPALAQAFVQTSNDAVVSVVVNHLKSKGSSCDGDGDPNIGDGQGNCNVARRSAAAAIAGWVALDPTNSGDPDYLIIGDLNAYTFEEPLTTLKDAGFVNLVESNGGGEAYSFVFDGQSGALDHALATASLVPQVAGIVEWHINADEPPVRDYNLESGRDPALFDGSAPYRASDHDPVIIGLDLTF